METKPENHNNLLHDKIRVDEGKMNILLGIKLVEVRLSSENKSSE